MPGEPAPPRVALVTGGSSGIGRACRARLEGDGFTVVSGWHTHEPQGPAIRFDVTDAEAVDTAVDEVERRWGPVEAVVANAGRSHLDLAVRMPADRFREVVDLDLTGTLLVARAAAARMVGRRRGRIVLIGSAAGLVGVPGVVAYASAKAGLSGMARTMARELGGRGITVNVVAPGMLDDAVARIEAHRPRSGADRDWLAATPAGRAGTAEEVAAVVAFLVSDRAGATTGATLAVDGGFTIGSA